MIAKSRLLHFGVATSFALAGCAPAEGQPGGDGPLAQTGEAMVESNGPSLNGRSLNGRSLNGRSLNGRSLNGVSLGGVQVNGVLAGPTWLQETVFHSGSGKDKLAGRDFLGAVFTGTLDDQSALALRIDAMTKSPDDPAIYLYAVSLATDDGWQPLCQDEGNTPTTAIPLAGRWSYEQGVPGGGGRIDDPSAFTFACRGHALAKCVELGYAPWKSVNAKAEGGHGNTKVSLADHHQACTRMIRADYCGDGTPHTIDGTLINLYDGLGIQVDTNNWPFEAEWAPEGARCVTRQRELDAAAPSCWATLPHLGCGSASHFSSGARIMNEVAPIP